MSVRRQRVPAWLHALILLLLLTDTAPAEICPGNKVPKAELQQYDPLVTLSPAQEQAARQTHLPWGQPGCPRLLPQREYIVCYDLAKRVALRASYRLQAGDVASLTRRDAFRSDPRLT